MGKNKVLTIEDLTATVNLLTERLSAIEKKLGMHFKGAKEVIKPKLNPEQLQFTSQGGNYTFLKDVAFYNPVSGGLISVSTALTNQQVLDKLVDIKSSLIKPLN